MSGTLFVVATPIGNLGDISERALQTLRSADRILAEDTRRTRGLLSHFGIPAKSLDAFHAHSTPEDASRFLRALLEGETIALVTDAGTPAVSDPGSVLVEAAIEHGVRVVPIPGASAVLAALVGSGLLGGKGFRFVGFLPRDGQERHEAISALCEASEAVVLFESPNRTHATLGDLARATPERRAAVARELTKVHEEFLRGTLESLAAREEEYLGEIAIVLGEYEPASRAEVVTDDAIDQRISEALESGHHAKGIAERIAAWSGRPKRAIYERVIEIKNAK